MSRGKQGPRTAVDGTTLWPLPMVAAAIGMNASVLTTWSWRGYRGVPATGGRQGLPVLLDETAALRLAVMRALAELGISPALAGAWVAEAGVLADRLVLAAAADVVMTVDVGALRARLAAGLARGAAAIAAEAAIVTADLAGAAADA